MVQQPRTGVEPTTSRSQVRDRALCSSSTTYIAFTARCTLVQSAVLRSHVVCLYVRPSDCLSVTLVNCDHIGWNSSKIIPLLASLGRSLFATPTKDGCALRGTALDLGPNSSPPVDLSVIDIRSQIAAEWLQIAQRSQWRAYKKLAFSNGAIADPL